MRISCPPVVVTLLAAACALRAGAPAEGVEVSAPLAGWHRPGRYMPLEVRVSPDRAPAGAVLAIEAEEAVTTRVRLSAGRAAGTVPFLPLSPLRRVQWRILSAEGAELAAGEVAAQWRALTPDQALVGHVLADPRPAQALFPDSAMISVRLDGGELFAGAPEAWETLDAVVLDDFPLFDARKVPQLMASGIALAARGPQRPDSHWPWNQTAGLWVLRAELRGPRLAGDDPAALLPVDGWVTGWPAHTRRLIVLFAVAFAIMALAASLLRRRGAALLIALVAAATSGAVAMWRGRQSPVLHHGGMIIVTGGDIAQTDRWYYRASADESADAMPWFGGMRPFVESRRLIGTMRLSLLCDQQGDPLRYEYRLWPGMKTAFVSRALGNAQTVPAGHANTPMLLVARRVYLRRGDTLAASASEVPGDPAISLGAVLIRAARR